MQKYLFTVSFQIYKKEVALNMQQDPNILREPTLNKGDSYDNVNCNLCNVRFDNKLDHLVFKNMEEY